MRVLVHGGAGGPSDAPDDRQEVLDRAALVGCEEHDPLTAAVRATRELERAPQFNAGVGSAVQSDGRIRTDAGVMSSDGIAGAACAMEGVEHAASVANVVATETPHILIAGERAVALANAFNIPTEQDLWTDRTRERWEALDPPPEATRNHLQWVREQFGGHDTVGAVATDGEGVAAVTSTGGRWCALAGRVGDVPQVGAGFYATETAAASTTGAGEAIARFGLARQAAEAASELHPQLAADHAMCEFEAETGAEAGVIVIDTEGRTGSEFNSEAMQTAVDGWE